MSTFYLLPPRPLLGECFAEYMKLLFPGAPWDTTAPSDLAGILESALLRHPDVFVVYREELPEGEATARALANGFGAEANDEVIEVRPGKTPGAWTTRRWRMNAAA